jgi:hypothetical protein
MGGVQWQFRTPQQLRQGLNGVSAARRTLIDGRLVPRDGLGIRPTSGKPAFLALGLRQQPVDLLN